MCWDFCAQKRKIDLLEEVHCQARYQMEGPKSGILNQFLSAAPTLYLSSGVDNPNF
jgi:hypothetical protein